MSNLDYNISAREWKKILFTEFQQQVKVRGPLSWLRSRCCDNLINLLHVLGSSGQFGLPQGLLTDQKPLWKQNPQLKAAFAMLCVTHMPSAFVLIFSSRKIIHISNMFRVINFQWFRIIFSFKVTLTSSRC